MRPSRRTWSWLWLLTAFLIHCEGDCLGCGPPPLAELVTLSGPVQRDHDETRDQWQEAETGALLYTGDAVRTLEQALAELRVGGSSRLRLEPLTIVRFSKDPNQATRVGVSMGEATLEAGSEGKVLFHTAFGLATLEAGSAIRLSNSDGTLRLKVVVGGAMLKDKNGGIKKLSAPQELAAVIGEVGRLRAEDNSAPSSRANTAPDASNRENTPDAGSDLPAEPTPTEARDRALAARTPSPPSLLDWAPAESPRPHIALPAGASSVLHAASGPIVVRIPTPPSCPHGMTLRARSRGLRARKGVHVTLKAGWFAYRVYCLNPDGTAQARPTTHGRLRLLRDTGKARLPRTAPATMLDADGRPYTVIYQNRLPKFIFRWPKAPARGPYTLKFSQGGPGRDLRSSRPRFQTRPGQLREGTHIFRITAGSKQSRSTRVKINFDNVAPKASISSPEDGSFAPGQTVTVAGIVLQGWRVSVQGVALPLDAQFRFRTTLNAPQDLRSLPIRLSHRSHGTHYYLRRASDP